MQGGEEVHKKAGLLWDRDGQDMSGVHEKEQCDLAFRPLGSLDFFLFHFT